jgi:hypothetical protein
VLRAWVRTFGDWRGDIGDNRATQPCARRLKPSRKPACRSDGGSQPSNDVGNRYPRLIRRTPGLTPRRAPRHTASTTNRRQGIRPRRDRCHRRRRTRPRTRATGLHLDPRRQRTPRRACRRRSRIAPRHGPHRALQPAPTTPLSRLLFRETRALLGRQQSVADARSGGR